MKFLVYGFWFMFCFSCDQMLFLFILIFSFSTMFSFHLIFPLLMNLFTPFFVLNLFLYFLGKIILKNSSNQLLVLGMFLFSMYMSVLSMSLAKFRMNLAISSGKNFIWLYNSLNRILAFFIVFCSNISDILLL